MSDTKNDPELLERGEEGSSVLRLGGRLDRDQAAQLWPRTARALDEARPKHLVIDLKNLAGIDSAGIVLLHSIENQCADRGIELSYHNIPKPVEQLLSYTKERSTPSEARKPRAKPGFGGRVGQWGERKWDEARLLIGFIGDFAASGIESLGYLHKWNIGDIPNHLLRVGWGAVPISLLMSFLMGMIIVFQGATTVGNFGSNIFIADMVAISVTREMAPLLTGVIIAGRSGSAFAAEIGSMKINEELEALSVMDFSITQYIVVPRVLSLIVAGPILTLMADAAGIVGGLVTSMVVVNLPPEVFMHEIRSALGPGDIYTGIIKGLFFATLVGLTGCYCGLRTKMSAAGIGAQTTSAVVIGILLIVAADALLVGLFHIYGI